MQACQFAAFHRTVAEQTAEFGLFHADYFFGGQVQQFVFRLKLRYCVALGMAVVRAALLALVAAIHALSYHFSHPFWQLVVALYGEARQAFPGIYRFASA